ncbi:MAG TPA: serine--tRNA ligase [Thermoanaerobaculia bacterium]|jgi:seryl-tRNA synthetase|nr:serine--tRNA ligase [Thermoanaerobaculia bacterium]
MLSRDLLRERPDEVKARLAGRGVDLELVDRWTTLDAERRSILVEAEALKQQRNEASKRIGEKKRTGADATEEIAAVGALKERIERHDARLGEIDASLQELELKLPNLPDDDVPAGVDESSNRVERVVGTPRAFEFEPRTHWDLGTALGILDFERAAKLAGARFAVYRGAAARLERALAAFMLDLHTVEHGYTELIPPYLTNEASLLASGQLPKFESDLFRLADSPYWLVPTSEVPLVNMHRGEILDETALPLRYTAFTPCFRSEAGSYGRDVRGLIRLHQFQKVELVQITTQETSEAALEEITRHAATVLERLELPYRVVTLSRGDTGFHSAKTHDLEVWLPSQSAYREISSCSNCRDFQARRGDVRYRPAGGGKPKLAHTLNGSGLAVGRTLVAVLENYQQADGSVVVPGPLRPYMGGLERIGPG